MDVEVDPEEDQRPEQDREHGRADALRRVEMDEVVVRGGDDRAGDEVDDAEDADPSSRSCGGTRRIQGAPSLMACKGEIPAQPDV
jgi:hypothetical protein